MNNKENNNCHSGKIKDNLKRKQSEIYSRRIKEENLDYNCIYFEYPLTLQASDKARFLNEFNSPPRNFILDIGCYNGEYLRYLSKKFGTHGVGIDISETCIRYSLQSDNDNNKYIVADAEFPPFKDNVFDGVLLMGILEHLPDPKKCISETYRVLKKGGRCLMYLSARDCKYTLPWLLYKIIPETIDKNLDKVGHDYGMMLTTYEILALLKEEGFLVIKKTKTGIFIQPLHDGYIANLLSEILYKVRSFMLGFSGNMHNYKKWQEDISAAHYKNQLGFPRKIYSKFILPVFKILIFFERMLMGEKLGYYVYLMAAKKV